MSVQLLDKTRKINKLLHNNNSHKVVFNDICEVLSEILHSNILVISKKGKVLGVAICPGIDEIEELIEGQKVVKVFCHEEAAKSDFDRLNEALCTNAYRANMYSGMMGPVNNNLGYLQYVLVAVAGAWLMSRGGGVAVGALMSFLLLTRSFNQPISQVSNQINAIVMALAGAERIFELMDAEPEEDGGYVTLVNVRRKADGSLEERPEHTGLWAWKHPHKAEGTVTYTELKGDITMSQVDFAYEPGKPVLHDVTLYAKPGQKLSLIHI